MFDKSKQLNVAHMNAACPPSVHLEEEPGLVICEIAQYVVIQGVLVPYSLQHLQM